MLIKLGNREPPLSFLRKSPQFDIRLHDWLIYRHALRVLYYYNRFLNIYLTYLRIVRNCSYVFFSARLCQDLPKILRTRSFYVRGCSQSLYIF